MSTSTKEQVGAFALFCKMADPPLPGRPFFFIKLVGPASLAGLLSQARKIAEEGGAWKLADDSQVLDVQVRSLKVDSIDRYNEAAKIDCWFDAPPGEGIFHQGVAR